MNREDYIGQEITALKTIQNKIYEIRGVKVMLDFDLAKLYGVETKVLNQAVKRNIKRFPGDFMFQLSKNEFENLKSQFVTSSWGGVRKLPFAFTEQGLAMLSGLLNSEIAINVNISIMRAFVAVRQILYKTDNVNKEITEIKNRLLLLEKGGNETLQAVNDLSEDMRNELDDIYLALGELAKKAKQAENNKDEPRNPIGFKRSLS